MNDNNAANGLLRHADSHGQAALLLVESLIHSLIARSVISVEDAVEIVAVAEEVAADMEGDTGRLPTAPRNAQTILKAVGQSLSHDL